MMRVALLVVPEAKSCCSTSSVRLPARAHSRAMATPLMPPPTTSTSKPWPEREARPGVLVCIFHKMLSEDRQNCINAKIAKNKTHHGDTKTRRRHGGNQSQFQRGELASGFPPCLRVSVVDFVFLGLLLLVADPMGSFELYGDFNERQRSPAQRLVFSVAH